MRQLIAFPHISKTGGTTILTILRSSFGAAHCDVEPWKGKKGHNFSPKDLRLLFKVYPHLKSINGHPLKPHENYESVCQIKYFLMVRDPIARCLSEFQHQVNMRKKEWSFEHYIKHMGFNHQTRFICGEPDHNAAIQILEEKNIICGMLEKFDESLLIFNKLVFQEQLNCSYTKQKTAGNESIRSKLQQDNKTMDLIEENNQEDIKLFAYIKDKLYPKYQKIYGETLSTDVQVLNHQGFDQKKILSNRLYRNIIYKPCLKAYKIVR